MIKLVINGSKGRMGQTLIALAKQDTDFSIIGEVDLGDDINAAAAKADVIVDFSLHDATLATAQAAAKGKTAIVIGTTGHTADEKNRVLDATRGIPVVWAANYSTGVNTLFYITRKVAEILGPGFDQEIVEMHHRFKKDAPSGTAERLAQILAEVKQKQLKDLARHGRAGIVGERTRDEIGIARRPRRRCRRRPHGHFCRARRASGTGPQSQQPRDIRARLATRSEMDRRQAGRALRYAGRVGIEVRRVAGYVP